MRNGWHASASVEWPDAKNLEMAPYYDGPTLKRKMAFMNKPISPIEGIHLAPFRCYSSGGRQKAAVPSSLRACDLPMLRPPVFDRHTRFTSRLLITHRECRPYRPRPMPRWSPAKPRDVISQPARTPSFRAIKVTFKVASDLGATRTNFRYNNTFSTSGDFCEKSARQQFCEEAHEIAWRRWAIVNPNCTDVQFQPVKAILEDQVGNQICAYWDVGFEFYDGSIVFGEIKPDETFFFDTKAALIANASAMALSTRGVHFARLHGTDFDDITRETIKEIFDYRRTEFDHCRDVEPVLNAIALAGQQITLGRASELIGGHTTEAKAKLCAMMVKRHVALNLTGPITSDTLLKLAPSATSRGALRRFLASCEPLTGEDQ